MELSSGKYDWLFVSEIPLLHALLLFTSFLKLLKVEIVSDEGV